MNLHGRLMYVSSSAEQGHIRILEHSRWTTREGSGTNAFDEVAR
jgi:hypothetical protein